MISQIFMYIVITIAAFCIFQLVSKPSKPQTPLMRLEHSLSAEERRLALAPVRQAKQVKSKECFSACSL
jgi:hypothetical protein